VKPGTPLYVTTGPDTMPLVSTNTLDARGAAAEVLAAYLRSVRFKRWGGTAPDTEFSLETVNDEWPDSAVQFRAPCATILDEGPQLYEEHSLTPTPLEETWHRFGPNTVLWKTAEAVCRFQVDFWGVDKGTREAISAALPALFNPHETRAGIMLSGEDRYFCRNVRATLNSYQRNDNEEQVWASQRRLTIGIVCEIDVVQLRCGTALVPVVTVDVDPVEE